MEGRSAIPLRIFLARSPTVFPLKPLLEISQDPDKAWTVGEAFSMRHQLRRADAGRLPIWAPIARLLWQTPPGCPVTGYSTEKAG